ncbi:ubiquitin-conjugating enzyme E2Q-like protein 1 [Coregonus clupeaformis]|uniref:ubiquitin-conjugating enzyme E2Q-like protein 1 n=1 Tax=Coregonus clupeaformis TaxID=59861 RepID=UPI001BE12930|nr:ubiquitin-conjugating enzyme E2Q-like protein 1 [Coregonus clupeaformis]XP_045078320.1 ubiquitin-conjugating enzyme E2Q-like protein 1 [Coregonus clupeaformis]
MATLLRKIGLIRLHDRDTEDPKHHQGSLKGTKGNTKNNTKQHSQTTNETNNLLSTPEIKAKKLDQHSSKDKPSVKDKQQGKDTKEKQQMGGGGGGGGIGVGKSATSASIPSVAPHRQHCTQVRTRRLMKELQEIRRLGDNFITVELVDDNLFDWNVKLHQVDKDSALWQDMKETNTEFILLNVSFPDNFPFSPPFMRVLTPRLENGYVLDGGAICMELLTPRGWSSAYTVEAVMRQFAASLVKGQGRICRKAGKSKKAFSRKEAEATFKSLVKTHEKYGWVSPPVSDG